MNDKNKRDFKLLTIDELMTLPDTQIVWTVKNFVLSQGITIVSGLPNHFKSLFVQILVKAVAAGDLFLNQYETVAGGVLVIDRELPNQRLKRRWASVGDLAGLPIYFYPYSHSFKLDHENDSKRLINIVKENNIKLVVIDTFNRSHSGKELNSPSDVAQVFEPLKELLEYSSVILIHHSNKSGYNREVPTPEELLGSVDFVAETDLLFTLRQKDKNTVLVYNLKSRDSELINPIELTVAAYPTGKIEMLYEGEHVPDDTPVEQREKTILTFLKEGKKTKNELIKHMTGLGHKEKTINNTLTVLRNKQLVASEKVNHEAIYYLLDNNRSDIETETLQTSQLPNIYAPGIKETQNQPPCRKCGSENFYLTKFGNKFCSNCNPPVPGLEIKEIVQ